MNVPNDEPSVTELKLVPKSRNSDAKSLNHGVVRRDSPGSESPSHPGYRVPESYDAGGVADEIVGTYRSL